MRKFPRPDRPFCFLGRNLKNEKLVPAEWEDVVTALRNEPGVTNPHAVANAMLKRGYKRQHESGRRFDPKALFRRHRFECQREEANSAAALGMLTRPGVKPC